ncbi:hypothetical protein [Mycobacterium sp. 1164985.4]|uniref:hypothetical protein n=1 Tax=Mycobacterium sp. 1164985.4 TaxID=1834069 RepID=UPI0012E99C62|nr:hypothetical protein [Mycobacterium sp. 1164985.4]
MEITRGLAVGIVVTGAAIGLAGPASAEPPSGSYTATVTTGNPAIDLNVGDTVPLIFTPCGADCTHLQLGAIEAFQSDLHWQGDTWIGTRTTETGDHVCTYSMNSDISVLTSDCPGYRSAIVYGLTKNG